MNEIKIYPRCQIIDFNQAIAITHDGYVMPCCNIMGPGVREVINLLGNKLQQLHVTSGSLDEILNSEASNVIVDSFSNNPMITCVRVCSRPLVKYESNSGGRMKIFDLPPI